MILLIDDLRTPEQLGLPADTLVARTSEAGIDLIEDELIAYANIDQLWLDHDLGPTDDMACDHYLEENLMYTQGLITTYIKKIFVHSQNPVGKARMIQALRASGYEVEAR